MEPIAIVGVGCRFPGAPDPEAFWRLLRDGVDAITEVPKDRWDLDTYYSQDLMAPGKMNTRWGGFVEGVDLFDSSFFKISRPEAEQMDPQQRLLLEVAWEALEDAGQSTEHVSGTQTGVFIGIMSNDYRHILQRDCNLVDAYTGTGTSYCITANRLSYLLNLHGPSIAVDTACSSSLVAVHLACCSLQSGECTMALAGGVNVILMPEGTIYLTKAHLMAPDGRCKTFDAKANGFVRGEGAGLIVLKLLSDALQDGDPIRAVIRGSAVNQDGRTNGLTAPSRWAQEAVLKEAHRQARISPSRIQYIEAHGTGTELGDAIELQALESIFTTDRQVNEPCLLGSVKTNIGHLEAAAGIAGLIKVVLSMQHRSIPPSLHFVEPNPKVDWQNLPLRVQRTLGAWPDGHGPMCAGISSFGFGGTNAHVVVEEAPQVTLDQLPEQLAPPQGYLLPLSACNPEALRALAGAYQGFLAAQADESAASVHDICYTASVRRTHHESRLAVAGRSHSEFGEHLSAFLAGGAPTGVPVGRKSAPHPPKIVFVFSGQGAQWPGMGQSLMTQEPVFRDALERCDQIMQQYADWSLLEELAADENHSRLKQTEIAQPAIFALQVALAELWRSWGITPDAVVGHSVGEVAAACVGGVLSLPDAAKVTIYRGRLMQQAAGQGKMATVVMPPTEVEHLLAEYEGRVSVAAFNGPNLVVLSGDSAAMDDIRRFLRNKKMIYHPLMGDFAFHSPQMEPFQPELVRVLAGINLQPAAIPIYSTVTGQAAVDGDFGASYWGRNIRQTVLFATAINKLVDDNYGTYLEVGPHPVLSGPLADILRNRVPEATVLTSLHHVQQGQQERDKLLESLGRLYTIGYAVNWNQLYKSGGRCVRLPSYPWQRKHFWLTDEHREADRAVKRPRVRWDRSSGHPQLGQYVKSAIHADTYFWEADLDPESCSYLRDHRIQGSYVMPAAAYIEMTLAAVVEAFGEGAHTLERISFSKQAIFSSDDTVRTIQLAISSKVPGEGSFQFFSRPASEKKQSAAWMLHSAGEFRLGRESETTIPQMIQAPIEEIKTRCQESILGEEFYQAMQERGFQFGPSFRSVKQLWRGNNEAIGCLRLPDTVRAEADTYQVYPALLDACFQMLAVALPQEDVRVTGGYTYLPTGLSKLRFYRHPCSGDVLWGYARLHHDNQEMDSFAGDVSLMDENGQVLIEAEGYLVQRLDSNMQRPIQEDVGSWFYEIEWQSEDNLQLKAPVASCADELGSWLVFADSHDVGQKLAALLRSRGETCITVYAGETYQALEPDRYQVNPEQPDEFQQLLQDALGEDRPPCRGIVHLWSLDAASTENTSLASLDSAQRLGCYSVLHLVQAVAKKNWTRTPRLWLVTSGVQRVREGDNTVAVPQSPLWGLGRVIAREHQEFRCANLDLGQTDTSQVEALFREVWTDGVEDQVALRGDVRYVARLVRSKFLVPEANEKSVMARAAGRPFRLEIETPGVLDNLTFRPVTRQKPGPGQVEIEVVAAGLNFLDVLSAMGIRPDVSPGGRVTIGSECVGRITALGEGVHELQVGDEVIAIAFDCFGSFVITPAVYVVPKPPKLSFEEAATIPIVFMTTYYALHQLGRLRPGERVLIHSATGGVGLAAIQVAQWIGAQVFATAGSPEKRDHLHSLGIEHVMDSRSLAFADEVMQDTHGQGIHVVLNSLAGEAIPRNLSILAPYGRFLEIGKRDIYQNTQVGLWPFQRNLSYYAIDLARMAIEHPDLLGGLLREVVKHIDDGHFTPLPCRVFPASGVVDAFRYMAQAKHIGKIVISMQDPEVLIPIAFRADATYLITGGLGGLGVTITEWMVKQGARHLVLVGRHGVPDSVEKVLGSLREAGAQVVIAKADVTQEQQVRDVLAKIDATMPPLTGIVHAAAVLDDGVLLNLDRPRFEAVMAPKMKGAWNLHTLTSGKPLDFFVLFSSVASVLGSPGQGNYAAANAFLSALAHYRHTQGLSALSIDWGPWSQVGLSANDAKRGERLQFRGINSIAPHQGLKALKRLLSQKVPEVNVMSLNLHQWHQFYPESVQFPLLAQLVQHDGTAGEVTRPGSTVRTALLAAEPEKRNSLLETYLQQQIAQVLRIDSSEIDSHTSLSDLGLDSLMSLELRNRLEAGLGLVLPATLVWGYPTIADLAAHLAQEMEIHLHPSGAQSDGTSTTQSMRGEGTRPEGGLEPELVRTAVTAIDLNAEAVLDLSIYREAVEPIEYAREPNSVFLTGATGFLGAFLLHELLQQTQAVIYCLVRASSEKSGKNRILQNLQSYMLPNDSITRIIPVIGDLTQLCFGLSSNAFSKLADEIDVIYHSGAILNFSYPYSRLKGSNVVGTHEVLRLASLGKSKPVHHVSTIAIFHSAYYHNYIAREEDYPDHSEGLYTGYAQSKWVAEKLAQSASLRGIPVYIYRPGLIEGHSEKSVCSVNKLLAMLMKGCIEMGMAPDMDSTVPLTPVDYVSRAIVHLSRQSKPSGRVFHLANPDTFPWNQLIVELRTRGYSISAVPYETWKASAIQFANRSAGSVLNSLLPLIESQATEGFIVPRSDCQNTLAELAGASLICPPVTQLLGRYLTSLIDHGFLVAPKGQREQ